MTDRAVGRYIMVSFRYKGIQNEFVPCQKWTKSRLIIIYNSTLIGTQGKFHDRYDQNHNQRAFIKLTTVVDAPQ